jgi:hypothetical protein
MWAVALLVATWSSADCPWVRHPLRVVLSVSKSLFKTTANYKPSTPPTTHCVKSPSSIKRPASTVVDAYTTTVTNAGNLTVNGTVTSPLVGDTALVGTDTGAGADNGHSASNAAGFTDVRLIDASAMTGKLAFTAEGDFRCNRQVHHFGGYRFQPNG